MTPNVKMIGRDKAHGFRRILQRPYQADGFLQGVMDNYILSSESMTQKIANSFDFREWLQLEISRCDQDETSGFGNKVQNLRSAKHRFESHTTPLGRFLLYLPAFIRVVTKICELKPDDASGRSAARFLELVTGEELLQLALLADAADEALVLVRMVDVEDVDLSEIPTFVGQFIQRIAALFKQEGALKLGYTRHVLEMMEAGAVSMLIKKSGQARRIRPPSREVIDRCLQRMKCWCKLAVEVVRTEFPDYSLFCAMGCFALKTGTKSSNESADVERLAQVFKVSPMGLKDQLERHRPLAEKFQRDMSCGNREAWQETLIRTTNMKGGGYPSDHLSPVVTRHIAWQAAHLEIWQFFMVTYFKIDLYHYIIISLQKYSLSRS